LAPYQFDVLSKFFLLCLLLVMSAVRLRLPTKQLFLSSREFFLFPPYLFLFRERCLFFEIDFIFLAFRLL
jgi:hypothetical protein